MEENRGAGIAHEAIPSTAAADRRHRRRVIRFYGIGMLFLVLSALLWKGSSVLLLLFACILMAVILYDVARRLQQWTHVPQGLALGIVIFLLAGLLGLAGWLMAPQLVEQADELAAAIPKALQRLQDIVEKHDILRRVIGELPPVEDMASDMAFLVPRAGLLFSGILGILGDIAIILFVGIYLAAQPAVYIDGIITLMPPANRERTREVFIELGHTLSQWLAGKAVAMVAVGIVTTVGLTLLGIPLAMVLGIIAGFLDFIPYVGPIVAGVPAVLIAFTESPELALYTVLLFLGIQTAEGYLLEPLIDRKTVSLPPALTIVMQALLGAMFGMAGVALATPLTAALAVLVTMLYVQDMLGDRVRVPSKANTS